MLNISPNSIPNRESIEQLSSFQKVNLSPANRMFTLWLSVTMIVTLVILLLPWRQNIQATGNVNTLKPNQRPQTIHSTIAGRIEKWYVQEGQLVEKGDTIVFLSEIKADYFDPELVSRTSQQVVAKEGAITSYGKKMIALDNQINALYAELELKRRQLSNKIRQSELKVVSDSIELERAKIDADIAQRQLNRTQELYDKGIKSLTELEGKKLKVQETKAKMIDAENKLMSSQNELANAQIQLTNIDFEYNQKIAKAESDKFSALSARYDAEESANKLRIQSSNYAKRSDFYYITAPQDAYITKALTPGLGETIKEGAPIVSIMPAEYQLAVELYIKPMDLPLIRMGQEVRFIFDGWPAFIFSGWPGNSFGTFRGNVVAIDNMVSKDSKYRILVAPDESEKQWPKELRPGAGAKGIALLNRVPLWYEIWRKLNGFPPDFYQKEETEAPKLKAPIKSIPK